MNSPFSENALMRTQLSARQAARLAAIVRDSHDAIYSKALDGTVLSWNPAAERLFGYTAEEIIGQSILLLYPPERKAEFYSTMERLRSGERIRHYDTVRLHKNGAPIHVSMTLSPLHAEDGGIEGASVISRDVTERKLLEDARQNAINILNAVVEGTTDGVYVKNREGRYLMINRAGARILGHTVAEVEGKFDYEMFDSVTYESIHDDDLRIMERGQAETVENVLPTTEGVRIFQSVKAPYRDAENNIIGIIGVSRDVSHLRHSEQALARQAALLDLTPNAISVRTLDGKITYWNRGAEIIYGWSAEQAIGKINHELLETQADISLETIQAKLLAEGRWHGELRQRTRGGKPLNVSSDQVLQYDEHGKPLAVLEVNQDITERKRREQTQEFLVQITNELSGSLDLYTTLQTIADEAVPFFADWCAVHVLTEDGMVQRLAFAHADPAQRERTNQRPKEYPLDTRAQHLVPYVIRTGIAEYFETVPDSILEQSARDQEHLEMLHQLGMTSYICVPLRARGNMLGTVTFAMSESGRRYTAADFDLAIELVRRAALAVDNARLYRESQAAQQSFELIAQASVELMSSLDMDANLQRLAHLIVPRFAEWCGIHLVREDGSMRLAALAHAHAELEPVLREWAERFPLSAVGMRGVPDVVRTGQLEWVHDLEPALTARAAPEAAAPVTPEALVYLRRLDLRSYVILPLAARGRVLGAVTFARSTTQPRYSYKDVVLAEEVTRRAAIALDNTVLYQHEQQARHAAEQAARHSDWLTEASDVLANSLDYRAALKKVAQLAVPRLADWCQIHILKEDGSVEQLALAHDDPDKVEWAAAYAAEISPYFADFDAPFGLPNVLRTGEAELYPEIPDSLLAQVAQNETQLQILRGLGYSSAMIVPLKAQDRVLGALTLVNTESRRRLDADDLAFAELLAGRAASAMENARLYEETRLLNSALEARVEQRTYELSEAYEELRREVAERTRAEETMRTLLHISSELNSTLDVSSVLDILMREAIRLMGGVRGFAGLRTARGMTVLKMFEQAAPRPFEYTWERGRGLPGWVLEHAKPYVTNDAANDPLIERDLPLHANVARAICTPVFDAQNEVIGFFEILDKQDASPFTGADVDFLMALAPLASIAIQNALAYQQILRAEIALQDSNSQLRALAARIETIREEERREIARELHDELGQALTALKMDVAAWLNRMPKRSVEMRARAQNMSDQIDATIKTVRRLSSQLRPGMLDDLGLGPSIEWYAHEFETRTGIECQVCTPPEDLELNQTQAIALFRIFQETLTNVARHADAKHVNIELVQHDGVVSLQIRDDGKGIDLSQVRGKHSLGLLGMRERVQMLNGSLEIQGRPGEGTTIVVQVPLDSAAPEAPLNTV